MLGNLKKALWEAWGCGRAGGAALERELKLGGQGWCLEPRQRARGRVGKESAALSLWGP